MPMVQWSGWSGAWGGANDQAGWLAGDQTCCIAHYHGVRTRVREVHWSQRQRRAARVGDRVAALLALGTQRLAAEGVSGEAGACAVVACRTLWVSRDRRRAPNRQACWLAGDGTSGVAHHHGVRTCVRDLDWIN